MIGKGGAFIPGGIYSGGGGDLILPCKNRGDLFRGGICSGGGGDLILRSNDRQEREKNSQLSELFGNVMLHLEWARAPGTPIIQRVGG